MHSSFDPFEDHMHDSQSEISRPLPDASLADAFYSAVEGLSRAVDGGSVYLVEAEAFAQGALKVRGELLRLDHCEGAEREDAEGAIVELLDRITTVALEASPRYREIHRAAFEVAVRASQLAFVLRDMTTQITWH